MTMYLILTFKKINAKTYRFANKITQVSVETVRDKNFAEVCFTNIFVVSQIL